MEGKGTKMEIADGRQSAKMWNQIKKKNKGESVREWGRGEE